ncbi:MAG: hypothetical protein ACKV2O_22090 [Acidimicrobiales bacterium]
MTAKPAPPAGTGHAPRHPTSAGVPSGARAVGIDQGRCRRGCKGNLVTVVMHIRGETVTMTSCSTCDHRSWARGGQSVDLRSLLEEIKAALPLRKAS